MFWWIPVGVVVVALVLLVLVVLPVLSRLGRLGRAAARTQAQLGRAETLQMSVAHLQERLTGLAEHSTGLQEQLAARRPPAGNRLRSVRKG
jgi:flagellar biosynthesis/type III secretory pathway M-ring protein FliF/YscJ